MKKFQYDLGFGDPVFVRKALAEFYQPLPFNIAKNTYPDTYGDPVLVKQIRDYIYSQTGLKFHHILITSGATQAVYVSLMVFKNINTNLQVSVNPYHYPYYQKIARSLQVNMIGDLPTRIFAPTMLSNEVLLLDSPSNPVGNIQTGKIGTVFNAIWDAAYHSKIYTDHLSMFPETNVMIGSFSKTFGLAGTRLGFLATNDPSFYTLSHSYLDSINCGSNLHGQELVSDIFNKVDVDRFQLKARKYLDDNRTEIIPLENKLGVKIPPNGMFYPMFFDKTLKEKLDDSGVGYILMQAGQSMIIRLSLGQEPETTRKAIKALMKIL